MDDCTRLYVGQEFSTLKALLAAVSELQKEQKILYWRRDSRTLKAAKKRGIDVPDNAEIKYYEIKFSCFKGGRGYKSSITINNSINNLIYELHMSIQFHFCSVQYSHPHSPKLCIFETTISQFIDIYNNTHWQQNV
ncbi:hypothetical protein GQR58_024920 [Nymphon striatum]|nr:hypothetical protein GQR58_024920 [Nymphon striatum]